MSVLTKVPITSTIHPSARGHGCIPYDPLVLPPTYGYDPSLAAGVTFTILFFLSMTWHIYESIRCRNWWYLLFAVGAFGECLGWLARAAAHNCPYNKTLYSLQIIVLVLAPSFFSAAIYYILIALIVKQGHHFSLLLPKWYFVLFTSLSFVSIFGQALGGGLAASSASPPYPPGDTTIGTRLMLAGVIVQLVTMSIFAFLWSHFLWGAHSKLHSERVLLLATSLATLLIMVRNLYRVLELSQGWQGDLFTHEVYFAVLDGGLMVLAVWLFNVVFPGNYLLSERDMRRLRSLAPRSEGFPLGRNKAVRGWGVAGTSV